MKYALFAFFYSVLFLGSGLVSAGSFMVSGSPVRSLATNTSANNIAFYKFEYAFDDFQDSIFPVISFAGFDENRNRVQVVAIGSAFRTSGAGLYAQGNIGAGFMNNNQSSIVSNTRLTFGLFIGWRNNNSNVRIGWEHISGNSSATDVLILNNAENFLVLSMQTPFIIRW